MYITRFAKNVKSKYCGVHLSSTGHEIHQENFKLFLAPKNSAKPPKPTQQNHMSTLKVVKSYFTYYLVN